MPTIAEQLATATDAYLANVPPFTTASQCSAFISACSKLILLTPTLSGNREGSMQFDVKLLQTERQEAQAWLNANGGTGTSASGAAPSRLVRADLRHFRE